ncbi:MAG: hypothetical protein AAF547_02220 [Actinomycetota bacterium]
MSEDTWGEVRSKIEGLGLKLKLHIDQERGAVADTVEEEDDLGTAAQTRAAVEDLGEKLQDVFNGLTASSKDPAVKADAKELGALLKDAVMETLDSVGADVRTRRPGDGQPQDGPSDPPPPPGG